MTQRKPLLILFIYCKKGARTTKTILDYARGKLTHEEFEAELNLHPNLWDEIQKLIPSDIADPNCPFRKIYGQMQLLESNNYYARAALAVFGYRSHFVYYLVSSLVNYNFPHIRCREPISESAEDLLFKYNLDYIGGAEAEDLVREILIANASETAKVKKQRIKERFQIAPRKHPNWMQEPEWPFRDGEPMRFVSQSNEGDLFKYVFENPSTGEQITVEQYA